MDMQGACAEVLAEVDGSLGCIVIDMQTGLTVAAEYQQGSMINPATINLVSVLSTNMFQGKLIRQFEGALARRSPGAQDFVREVQMTTEHTNQFMAVVPGWNQTLLVLVTDRTVSVGLGWMAVHRLLGRLGEGVPPPAMPPLATVPGDVAPATATVDRPPAGAVPAAPSSHEPFPDANRYAPPSVATPLVAAAPPATPQPPTRRYRRTPAPAAANAEAERAPQAPTRRYRGAPVPPGVANAETESAPEAPTRRYRGAPSQPEPAAADAEVEKKPRVVMGPRMSMFRRK